MIYALATQGDQYIKFGFTSKDTADERKENCQTGCPLPLYTVGTWDGDKEQEKDLHDKYARYRVSGEWFFYSKEIHQDIALGLIIGTIIDFLQECTIKGDAVYMTALRSKYVTWCEAHNRRPFNPKDFRDFIATRFKITRANRVIGLKLLTRNDEGT